MDGSPNLAVVIPARNASRTIERAVVSARTQQPPPASVVVVDDGSSDGTGELAARLGATVLRHDVAQGAAAARDAGARSVLSDVDAVAFLDADDEYLPGFLASAAATLASHPRASLVFGHAVERRDDGSWRCPPPYPARHLHCPVWALAWANLIPTSATVVPSWAYQESGGFSAAMGKHADAEDYDLWLRLALLGPFASTGSIGVLRYVEDSSFSRRPEALDRMLNQTLRAVDRNAAVLSEHAPWFPRLATGYAFREAARRSLARGLPQRCHTEALKALRCNPADGTAWALLGATLLPERIREKALELHQRWFTVMVFPR